jgi:hypothetical protein
MKIKNEDAILMALGATLGLWLVGITAIVMLLSSCGPQPDYIDATTIWGKDAGGKIGTVDDQAGENANNLRKYFSDQDLSAEHLTKLGVMSAEDLREYFYTRGVCEMRHGDNCKGGTKNGIDGRNGVDGVAGSNGQDGQSGIPGSNGAVGPQGYDGAPGNTGDQGPAGVNGQDGSDGIDGKDGANGATGPKGDQGEQGSTGLSGNCSLTRTLVNTAGPNCFYDFRLVCGIDSLKIAENKKDSCN